MRRPVIRSSAALAALIAAGCASPAGSLPPEQVSVAPANVRIESPGSAPMETRTIAENRAVLQTIKTSPDVAWSKLPAVYGELALPIAGYVDPSKQIMARGVRLRGRLGKTRLSQLVTCGSDMTGDDRANSYEVLLDVTTSVAPAPNGETAVQTMVTASARPLAVSGDPVRCVTTGSLEKHIANTILIKTASP